MALRKIDIININDGMVRHCPDDGCSVEGQPGQQRQVIEEMLTRRRVKVEVAPGDVRELPIWRLAKEPPPMVYPANEGGQKCASRDDFDRRVLRGDDGRWKMPSDEWMKAHAIQRKKRDQRDEEAMQMQNDRIAQRAGESLAQLMSLVNPTAAARAAGKPAKKGAEVAE